MRQTFLASAFASLMLVSSAFAGTLDDINSSLSTLANDWNSGSAAKVASHYTADAMIAGEQMPAPAKGPAEIEALIVDLIKAFPKADIKVQSVVTESSDQVTTWLLWTLPSADAAAAPTLVRSLYVWVKTQDGWKVKADSYSFGKY